MARGYHRPAISMAEFTADALKDGLLRANAGNATAAGLSKRQAAGSRANAVAGFFKAARLFGDDDALAIGNPVDFAGVEMQMFLHHLRRQSANPLVQ